MQEETQAFHQATASRYFWRRHHMTPIWLLHMHRSLLQTQYKASSHSGWIHCLSIVHIIPVWKTQRFWIQFLLHRPWLY